MNRHSQPAFAVQLEKHFGAIPFEMSELSGGASHKTFGRITGELAQHFNRPSLILQSTKDSGQDFLEIQRFLYSHNIPVPEIFFFDAEHSFFLIEDLGSVTLESVLATADETPRKLHLKHAVNQIVSMQALPPDPLCPAFQRNFDLKKYLFEYEFHFKTQLLSNFFGIKWAGSEEREFDHLMQKVIAELVPMSSVFTHRDYQSSNLLLTESGLKIVDFQDARTGSPLYDLVSLLEDAYIEISRDTRSELKSYFLEKSQLANLVTDHFERLYDLTLFQRKLHDAGAFAYCYLNLGIKRYLDYILPVLRNAAAALRRYPEFDAATAILDKIVTHGGTYQK